MAMLSDLEKRFVDFLTEKQSTLGLARIFQGEPQRIEDAAAAFVWTPRTSLDRTDEKYGRFIALVHIALFQSNIAVELKRKAAMDLAENAAILIMKNPELRLLGVVATGMSLNLRIADIRVLEPFGDKGPTIQGALLVVEVAVDKVNIDLSSY